MTERRDQRRPANAITPSLIVSLAWMRQRSVFALFPHCLYLCICLSVSISFSTMLCPYVTVCLACHFCYGDKFSGQACLPYILQRAVSRCRLLLSLRVICLAQAAFLSRILTELLGFPNLSSLLFLVLLVLLLLLILLLFLLLFS